jgi:hypothetical protein
MLRSRIAVFAFIDETLSRYLNRRFIVCVAWALVNPVAFASLC